MSEPVASPSHRGPAAPPALPRAQARWVWVAVFFLMILGLAARLSPLTDLQGRLLWQFMTEDGYLMQTIARNMALGLGMSTAEGSIATNGVQPMATYLFAGLHLMVGGDKTQAIVWVTLVSAAIALVSAWLLARVGERLLSSHSPGRPKNDSTPSEGLAKPGLGALSSHSPGRPKNDSTPSGGLAKPGLGALSITWSRELAWMVAALWFTAPLITRHSMNGLETGLYQAFILLSLLYYLGNFDSTAHTKIKASIVLGVLLGLTFLARNDAAFFIAALLLVHLITSGGQAGESIRRRFMEALLAGSVSILVASPWLVHNYLGFGSIIPISGTAQSHAAEIGRNLPWLMATLFENMWVWAPLPARLETMWPVQIFCGLAMLVAAWLYWAAVGRLSLQTRRHFLTGLLFTAGLAVYYGLFFGANWFLPRYFSALSPLLWFFAAVAAFSAVQTIRPLRSRSPLLAQGAVLALCLLAMAFAANDYRKGTDHMHKQVVDWTLQNIDATQWVAAPQTGTLGYFHDRTINLDGKVNPEALRRLIEDGHSLNYVLDLPVNYLVDWAGLAGWVEFDHFNPQFGQSFEVLVHDPERNLAVLKRRPLEN